MALDLDLKPIGINEILPFRTNLDTAIDRMTRINNIRQGNMCINNVDSTSIILTGEGADRKAERVLGHRFKHIKFNLNGEIYTFKLLEKKGAGSFGVVYMVEQVDLNGSSLDPIRTFALKIQTPNEKEENAIIKESIINYYLQKLTEGNNMIGQSIVPKIYFVGKSGGIYFILGEYINEPLNTYIRRNPYKIPSCLWRLTKYYSYMANRGIQYYHNDFKSDNVMVDFQNNPRIIDFGWSAIKYGGKWLIDTALPNLRHSEIDPYARSNDFLHMVYSILIFDIPNLQPLLFADEILLFLREILRNTAECTNFGSSWNQECNGECSGKKVYIYNRYDVFRYCRNRLSQSNPRTEPNILQRDLERIFPDRCNFVIQSVVGKEPTPSINCDPRAARIRAREAAAAEAARAGAAARAAAAARAEANRVRRAREAEERLEAARVAEANRVRIAAAAAARAAAADQERALWERTKTWFNTGILTIDNNSVDLGYIRATINQLQNDVIPRLQAEILKFSKQEYKDSIQRRIERANQKVNALEERFLLVLTNTQFAEYYASIDKNSNNLEYIRSVIYVLETNIIPHLEAVLHRLTDPAYKNDIQIRINIAQQELQKQAARIAAAPKGFVPAFGGPPFGVPPRGSSPHMMQFGGAVNSNSNINNNMRISNSNNTNTEGSSLQDDLLERIGCRHIKTNEGAEYDLIGPAGYVAEIHRYFMPNLTNEQRILAISRMGLQETTKGSSFFGFDPMNGAIALCMGAFIQRDLPIVSRVNGGNRKSMNVIKKLTRKNTKKNKRAQSRRNR